MYQRFITLAVIALMLCGPTAFAQCGSRRDVRLRPGRG